MSSLGAKSDDEASMKEDDLMAVTGEQDSATIPTEAEPDRLEKPVGIEDFGTAPSFGSVAGMLDLIERKRGDRKFDKNKLLRSMFERWRTEVGPDLHPLIRLLLPERDNRRRKYALKEQKLAKALSTALELPPESEAARKLKDWKVPTRDDRGAGEFSSVAYDVIKTRSTVITPFGTMNVHDVNKILDDLSRVSFRVRAPTKFSPQAEQARILRECLGRLTPLEMKWLIRIILQDLKVGVSERLVFNAFHPDALDMFNRCSDILQVCWKLYDPNFRLQHEDKRIHIGQAFSPMLCYRSKRDLDTVVRMAKAGRTGHDNEADRANPWYCNSNEFFIEEKLDGERIQLHIKGSRFYYWSRKAKDYTDQYGANRHTGSMTPFIYDCFHENLEELVLDGEMLVWNPEAQQYLAFGQLKSFSNQTRFSPTDPRPCFKIFDVLWAKTYDNAEGKCFLNIPLWRRKHFLSSILTPKKGIIEIADCEKGTSTADLSSFLKRILEERGEGMVVKHPLSTYTLAGRDSKWIKLKPDYMDQLGEAVSGDKADAEDFMPLFYSECAGQVVKKMALGSGFNFDDYKMIAERHGGKWLDLERDRTRRDDELIPPWMQLKENRAEWPDQILHPDDSFIVEVKAAELVGSRDYVAGYTLRFPRANRIHELADGSEDTLQDIHNKVRNANNKRAVNEDLSGSINKRAKTRNRTTKVGYISRPHGNIDSKSKVFDGMIFYVHNLKPREGTHVQQTKHDIEKLVLEHGGEIWQKIPEPEEDRAVIATSIQGIFNKKGAKNGECDILFPEWVLDSIKNGYRMPSHKKYFVFATTDTRALPEYEEGSDEEEEGDDDDEVDDIDDVKIAADSQQLQVDSIEPNEFQFDENTKISVEPSIDTQQWKEEQEYDRLDRDAESSESEPETEDEDEHGAWTAEPLGRTSESLKIEGHVDNMALSDAPPGLGAGHGELHYNSDKLFEHLLFYFDTESNAELNGLTSQEGRDESVDKRLSYAQLTLIENGGLHTINLYNSKLTHIVVDAEASGRYKELLHKTSKPRYRRIVTPQWIQDCLDQGSLLDEDKYKT
ncbi:DNA ligase (ATP) [Microbotryomycetes sp. JL221]|nr:DNA ligase (ATP) [Microbotryomycetes sp. JL221]